VSFARRVVVLYCVVDVVGGAVLLEQGGEWVTWMVSMGLSDHARERKMQA
jgi:hypothetical protein